MKKNHAPLFISEALIKRCFDGLVKIHPEIQCHLKVFVEYFIVEDGDPLYLMKESKWHEMFEGVKGEVVLEGGISSSAYLAAASQQYVDGRFIREFPKMIFPGDVSKDDVSVADNKSYGIFIVGCVKGRDQEFFITDLKDIIITEIRSLEKCFPFESKKYFSKTVQDWQKFIEAKTLADFKEMPDALEKIKNERPDMRIDQIKGSLASNEFHFSTEDAQKIQYFIEQQENFKKI